MKNLKLERKRSTRDQTTERENVSKENKWLCSDAIKQSFIEMEAEKCKNNLLTNKTKQMKKIKIELIGSKMNPVSGYAKISMEGKHCYAEVFSKDCKEWDIKITKENREELMNFFKQ